MTVLISVVVGLSLTSFLTNVVRIVLAAIALRTENLLFHRAFATYSLVVLIIMSVKTLGPINT